MSRMELRGLTASEKQTLRILAAQAGYTSLNQYLLALCRRQLKAGKP